MRRHKSCQYIRENGKKCGQKLTAPAWRYCSECREDGQKKAKARRDKRFSRFFRIDKADQYRLNLFRARHHLTKKHLEPLLNTESLQELYALSRDDFYQSVLNTLNEISNTLLSPPADLPRAAATAKKAAEQLLQSLEAKQQDSRPDALTDRFILSVKALQRDIGQWVSPQAFREIGSRATLVRYLWREHGELLPLVHCLFVEVELCRLQRMANPNRKQFWNNKACGWLSGAEFICDLALDHPSTGEQKQTANFLRFYTGLGNVQLAFDDGDQAQATKSMTVVQQLANDVTSSYGTGPVTETVEFLTSMNQAELYMRLGKTDCAYQYFKEAEHIFSAMQRHSLEPQLHVAYLKARLALTSNDHNKKEYLQEYISLLQCHPVLTHYSRLLELKRLFPKDVPEASIAKGVAYMDTMFRHLYPIVMNV